MAKIFQLELLSSYFPEIQRHTNPWNYLGKCGYFGWRE